VAKPNVKEKKESFVQNSAKYDVEDPGKKDLWFGKKTKATNKELTMGLDGKLDELNQRFSMETHKSKIKFRSKVKKGVKITRVARDRPESQFGKILYPEKLINWAEEDNEIDYLNRQIGEKNRINAEKQRIMDLEDDDVGDEVPNEPGRKRLAESNIISNNKSSIMLGERNEMSENQHSPNNRKR